MNVDATLLLSAVAAGVGGLLAAWAATLPVLRVKDLRPKAARDAGGALQGEHAVVVQAVLRHARCGACRHDCTPSDVAPVTGWRRRCPSCGADQPNYVLPLQVGTALASVVTVLTFRNAWAAVPILWLGLVLAAVAVVDARSWVIPKRLIWTGAAVGLVLLTVSSIAVGEPQYVVSALVGAAGAFALFFVLALVGPMGFSDVRLSALLGLYLGWVGGSYGGIGAVRMVLYGLLAGSLVGVVWGLVSRYRAGRRSTGRSVLGHHFAYGPALGVGALVVLWAHRLLLG